MLAGITFCTGGKLDLSCQGTDYGTFQIFISVMEHHITTFSSEVLTISGDIDMAV